MHSRLHGKEVFLQGMYDNITCSFFLINIYINELLWPYGHPFSSELLDTVRSPAGSYPFSEYLNLDDIPWTIQCIRCPGIDTDYHLHSLGFPCYNLPGLLRGVLSSLAEGGGGSPLVRGGAPPLLLPPPPPHPPPFHSSTPPLPHSPPQPGSRQWWVEGVTELLPALLSFHRCPRAYASVALPDTLSITGNISHKGFSHFPGAFIWTWNWQWKPVDSPDSGPKLFRLLSPFPSRTPQTKARKCSQP